jgi:quinol monooxygenase YgiN
MEDPMFQIYARLPIKEGVRDEVVALVEGLIEGSRSEDGNISYQLFQSTEDPNILAFFEQWKDEEAMAVHRGSEHFTSTMPKLQEYLAAPSSIEVFELLV